MEALGRFEGGEEVDGSADVRTEAVRSTRCARDLVVFISRDESNWRREDSFLSTCSPDSECPGKTLSPVFRDAWEGCTSRDGGGMVTLRCCVVSCMELANKMGQGTHTHTFCGAYFFPSGYIRGLRGRYRMRSNVSCVVYISGRLWRSLRAIGKNHKCK